MLMKHFMTASREIMSKFHLLFGSQTGQAEAIAQELAQRTQAENLDPQLSTLDDYMTSIKKDIKQFQGVAVIVISSTGDGDPPENALKFVRQISRKGQHSSTLNRLRFALLGLGDSNYSTFHGCPKKVESRLLDLGAEKFHETGLADDAVGLETTAEPWMEALVPALKAQLINRAMDLDSVSTKIESLEIDSETDKSPEESKAANEQGEPEKESDRKEPKLDSAKPNDLSQSDASSSFRCELPQSSERAWKAKDEEEGESEEDCDLSLSECLCVWPSGNCLIRSELLHSVTELRVPLLPESFLQVSFSHEYVNTNELPWQNAHPFPGTLGGLIPARLATMKKITNEEALVSKFEFTVEIENESVKYEPGDAFYVTFPNPAEEVEYILRRIQLAMLADNLCSVTLRSDTKAVNPAVPLHIPPKSSLRHILTWCLDIRRTPGRPFLRVMAEHARDQGEKRRLLELTSSQGLKEFTEFVRKAGLSVCDLLHAFPSVLFPSERLLELLPRLQPRPYSVACDQSELGLKPRFAFSQVSIPKGDGRFHSREGLCTSYLLNRSLNQPLTLIFQEPKWFRLPPNAAEIPLILVGPGTGLTPYLGFLQLLKKETPKTKPERWLFFGFRDINHDAIYKSELETYAEDGTLSRLFLCESRPTQESDRPKYVQDAMKTVSAQLLSILESGIGTERESRIYVCGDAKGMSKDVYSTLLTIIEDSGKSKQEAIKFLSGKKERHTYAEDVWG